MAVHLMLIPGEARLTPGPAIELETSIRMNEETDREAQRRARKSERDRCKVSKKLVSLNTVVYSRWRMTNAIIAILSFSRIINVAINPIDVIMWNSELIFFKSKEYLQDALCKNVHTWSSPLFSNK